MNVALVLLVALLAISTALKMSATTVKPGRGQVLGLWTTSRSILNLGNAPRPSTSSAAELASELKMSMLKMKAKYIKEGGMLVDYEGLKKSEEYKAFTALTQRLQGINLKSLAKHEMKGFLINIYNCLCIHALTEGLLSSFPGGTLSRLRFYAKSSYLIGGTVFSLNDIENGLLRNNKVSAAPWSKPPFAEGDPSLQLCVDCDPKIHFALNCGAKSCPPIAVYSVDSVEELEEQLNAATLSFISQPDNVKVDAKSKTLYLSQLFEWYADDFDNGNVVDWLKRHMEDPGPLNAIVGSLGEGESPTIKSVPYNWGLNKIR